MSVRLC